MTRLHYGLLFLLALLSVTLAVDNDATEAKSRSKRNYYGGYDYGYGDDYWYAGRIFGIIIGCLLFLLCCCAPCICLAGIWFLGWFGLRDRRARRNADKAMKIQHDSSLPAPMAYTTASRPREVIIDTAPPPRTRNDHIIYQAEDRFYSSSAPVTANRDYRSSNF